MVRSLCCGGNLRVVRDSGAGAVLSGPASSPARTIPAGRRRQFRRSRAGAIAVGTPRAVRGGGEPAGLERQCGRRGRRPCSPDGYTILESAGSLLTVNPHLYATMPFDPFKDLLPVVTITSDELLLSENPAFEPKSFHDFIDYASRAKPPLLYGSIGNGSEHHLAMELLKEQAGIQMTHVPYRGGAAAALGVMGGEVAAMFGGASVTPLVQAGKLRALAISGRKRSPIFPDLPSISEIYPAYDVTIWQALFVPPATPPDIVARLRAAANAVIAQPEFAEKLAAAGSGEPFATTPEQMAALIRADDERFGRVIRASGLKVE